MHGNYHTQHAPFGAFASFTIGLHNASGGFGQALSGPAQQSIFIGYRRKGDKQWTLLPFFKGAEGDAAAAFTGTDGVKREYTAYRQLEGEEIERRLEWASDTWRAGAFSFSIYSPFDRVPEPSGMTEEQARFFTAPVVAAELGFDNTEGAEEVEIMFGMGDPAGPARPLMDAEPDLCGFATGGAYGYATRRAKGVRGVQALSVLKPEFGDLDGLHRLGGESAIVATVAPGERRVVPLALGFYRGGSATTGIDCSFFYTRYFANLDAVLKHGLAEHGAYIGVARERDAELNATALSDAQKWLLAQSTHSYYGSSELLLHEGKPLWVVNEGEYRMMNTFDLTVDHLFFELAWHPWAMRNALDLFVSHYAYRDGIKSPAGETGPGGISFTHDMGIADQFSPPGRSSYECWNVDGCFSQMTMEQLVNWVCCAVTYAARTGDMEWLEGQRAILLECKQSLENRDHPDARKRDGLMKWDSDRCGTGSEITTYDSLDVSLGQARNNLYLAVKTLAAWLLLEQGFRDLGLIAESAASAAAARRLAGTLSTFFEEDTGFFPAVFEAGNRSRILPAVEGLVFPLYLGMVEALGRFPELIGQLRMHMTNALRPGVCLDAKSGGWKISSTSFNSWFSKIALAQHVTRSLFPEAISAEAAAGDTIHAAWEQSEGTAPWAMCDQIHSETGTAIASKYYPRGVTAFLWLSEKKTGRGDAAAEETAGSVSPFPQHEAGAH